MNPTFSLIVDPFIDFSCRLTGVAEVQVPALTLEVGLVRGHKGLLHGEAVSGEHCVGNQHNILVGFGRQGLVQLSQHLVWSCADRVKFGGFLKYLSNKFSEVTLVHEDIIDQKVIQRLNTVRKSPYRFSCNGEL